MYNNHIPVLIKEINSLLPDKVYGKCIDITFGRGGYSRVILQNNVYCEIIALDYDVQTFLYYLQLPSSLKKRCYFFNKNFSEINLILYKLDNPVINFIIFDLGISSIQTNNGYRGFSFFYNNRLDMRLNNNNVYSPIEAMNKLNVEILNEIIYYFGGEKKSKSIIKIISNNRLQRQIFSIYDLTNTISNILSHNSYLHWCTQSFQSLRGYINQELENLRKSVTNIIELASINCVIVFISFHSVEDKLIKEIFFRVIKYSKKNFLIITKNIFFTSYKEIRKNRRSRSAKLRFVKRIK